jgi:hypothetical protein
LDSQFASVVTPIIEIQSLWHFGVPMPPLPGLTRGCAANYDAVRERMRFALTGFDFRKKPQYYDCRFRANVLPLRTAR